MLRPTCAAEHTRNALAFASIWADHLAAQRFPTCLSPDRHMQHAANRLAFVSE
jgi:hypothetical protein